MPRLRNSRKHVEFGRNQPFSAAETGSPETAFTAILFPIKAEYECYAVPRLEE